MVMNRFLPVAWVVFIPISAFVWFFTGQSMISANGFLGEFTMLFSVLPSALFFGAMAAVYEGFRRTTNNALVLHLGWAHFICVALSNAFGGYFRFLRSQVLPASERARFEDLFIWAGASGLFSLLSGIMFLAAAYVALRDARKRVEPETFD